MRTVKIIMWFQLVLGLVGGYAAFAYMHWGAMSARASSPRLEYDEVQQSPVHEEPTKIRQLSLKKILEDCEASDRARANAGLCWLASCGALAIFAAVDLWLVRHIVCRPLL